MKRPETAQTLKVHWVRQKKKRQNTDLFDALFHGGVDAHGGDERECLVALARRAPDLEVHRIVVAEKRRIREQDARTQNHVIQQKRHSRLVHTWKTDRQHAVMIDFSFLAFGG